MALHSEPFGGTRQMSAIGAGGLSVVSVEDIETENSSAYSCARQTLSTLRMLRSACEIGTIFDTLSELLDEAPDLLQRRHTRML